MESTEVVECAFCRGKVVSDADTGERICTSCGVVLGQEHVKPDVRSIAGTVLGGFDFSARDPISSVRTQIDSRNVDSNGNQIVAREELEAMRRLDKLAIGSDLDRRNVVKALTEIRRTSDQLSLGRTVELEARSIYLKAFHLGLIRGRSIYGIVTAAVYLACRKHDIPRSIEEVAEFSQNEDKHEIAAYCRLLIRKLDLDLTQPKVESYISQIASNSRLSQATQREAIVIIKSIENNPSLMGKRPISLAAAALYLASKITGEHKSQLRVAGGADLSPATVRKSALEIERYLKEVGSKGTLQS
ncbi:MAG: hypothetical protein JRN15_07955 [Nitrososphaerota archaeon]|nr:hypothetical protein [Nitrososphaerota archaeon]